VATALTTTCMEMRCLVTLLLVFLELVEGGLLRSAGDRVRLTEVGPARVDGRLSGSVVLTCTATGSPAPALAWYKDSLFLSHQDQEEGAGQGSLGETVARLVLSCLTEADGGQYECRARAGREQESAVTELNVVHWEEADTDHCTKTRRPEISVWRPTVLVEVGRTVSLPCQTNSEDSLVTWSTRGVAIQAGGRIKISKTGELEISDVNWSDMGQYTCTVTNTGGSDIIQSFIYPLSP